MDPCDREGAVAPCPGQDLNHKAGVQPCGGLATGLGLSQDASFGDCGADPYGQHRVDPRRQPWCALTFGYQGEVAGPLPGASEADDRGVDGVGVTLVECRYSRVAVFARGASSSAPGPVTSAVTRRTALAQQALSAKTPDVCQRARRTCWRSTRRRPADHLPTEGRAVRRRHSRPGTFQPAEPRQENSVVASKLVRRASRGWRGLGPCESAPTDGARASGGGVRGRGQSARR